MQEILIKIEIDSLNNPSAELSTPKIVDLLTKLNIQKIEPELDEDLMQKKYHVLTSLQRILNKYKELGDTSLIYKKGKCSDCYPGRTSHIFKGNNSGKMASFVIIEKEEGIVDLFQCMFFKNLNGEWGSKDSSEILMFQMLIDGE